MKNLTKREEEVIELLVKGLTNKKIAESLFISVHTVKATLENIYDKLNVHSRILVGIYYIKQHPDKFAQLIKDIES